MKKSFYDSLIDNNAQNMVSLASIIDEIVVIDDNDTANNYSRQKSTERTIRNNFQKLFELNGWTTDILKNEKGHINISIVWKNIVKHLLENCSNINSDSEEPAELYRIIHKDLTKISVDELLEMQLKLYDNSIKAIETDDFTSNDMKLWLKLFYDRITFHEHKVNLQKIETINSLIKFEFLIFDRYPEIQKQIISELSKVLLNAINQADKCVENEKSVLPESDIKKFNTMDDVTEYFKANNLRFTTEQTEGKKENDDYFNFATQILLSLDTNRQELLNHVEEINAKLKN